MLDERLETEDLTGAASHVVIPFSEPVSAPVSIPGHERPDDTHAGSRPAQALPGLDPVVLPTANRHSPLAPYEEFAGSLPPAMAATKRQLLEGITAIVAVEGPMVGHRLHTAYVKASGGYRVGRQIATVLNSAITSAVRRGLLIEDNPLGEAGVKPRTYRIPDQPITRIRHLGSRPFEYIPPRELALILSLAAEDHGWESEETLYRATLDLLGLKRLTTNVLARFEAVLPLARPEEI